MITKTNQKLTLKFKFQSTKTLKIVITQSAQSVLFSFFSSFNKIFGKITKKKLNKFYFSTKKDGQSQDKYVKQLIKTSFYLVHVTCRT